MGTPSDERELHVDLEQMEAPDAYQRMRRAFALILRAVAQGGDRGNSGDNSDNAESAADKHPAPQARRDFDTPDGKG